MDALAAGVDDGYDEAPSVQSQEIQQRSQQQHVAPLAATTTRRVTFHPSVTAIDLSTEGPSQRSSTPRIPNPAKHPSSIPVKPSRMSAAAQRRAKLEAVLMALPTTKDDDEEKPLTTKAEDLQDEVAKAFHAPQHTTGWDRTLSTLAMDEDGAAAAHRVINAPCPGVGSAIAPQELRSVLKPHQWEALRFMWQCLMEEDDDSNNNNNNGDGNNGVRGGPVRRPRNDSLSGAVKSSLKKRARTEESSPSSHLKMTDEEHRDEKMQRPSTKYDFDDILPLPCSVEHRFLR
ncbi:Hypothetical protein, putative [Bodo saltans]|uniref:Uncharacterized protein n=1 Tax=Bodo saltans TaxID=75058 RepID=A0A0S4JRI8_BODSA|nr:Hypothetical protein, putative [Bodo saltans]|eukprot:CUG92816.1 Hypothetical protein, putative [Bodo saltans]